MAGVVGFCLAQHLDIATRLDDKMFGKYLQGLYVCAACGYSAGRAVLTAAAALSGTLAQMCPQAELSSIVFTDVDVI
jgi:hypothetical protein